MTVHYGFDTPPGARMPQMLSAKLVGPITSGFVDPLQAKIDTPGYSGPLKLKIAALTHDLDAKFSLDFDALPEAIFISEDPREDGLDVLYEHSAPVADVHLDAKASLRNRTHNELLDVGAQIERLPQRILLKNTNTADTTDISYESSSALSNPDLTATYRDLDGDGSVVTDAKLDVAGLPPKMAGTIKTVPNDEGGSDIDSVDFHVVEGQQIDSRRLRGAQLRRARRRRAGAGAQPRAAHRVRQPLRRRRDALARRRAAARHPLGEVRAPGRPATTSSTRAPTSATACGRCAR